MLLKNKATEGRLQNDNSNIQWQEYGWVDWAVIQKNKLNLAYFDGGEGEILVYSSKSSRGRKELWREIIIRIEADRKKDTSC